MKKLICLLVVLMIAEMAFAAPVSIISNGIIQGPWTNGSGRRQIRNYGHVQGTNPLTMYVNPGAPDGGLPVPTYLTPAAGTTSEADGWSELMGGGAALGANRYLDIDVYFPSKIYNFSTNALTLYTDPDGTDPAKIFNNPANQIQAMHITVNGVGWSWKWENTSLINVDGVWTTMAAYGSLMTQDTWHHLQIDLTSNTLPTDMGGAPLQLADTDVISGMQFYLFPINAAAPRATIYISQLALTETAIPEPATIALLGLGGLALVRRKR